MKAEWRALPAWPYSKRTRQPDRFQTSWARSLDKLEREIEHLGGRDVLIGVVTDPKYLRLDGGLKSDWKPLRSGVEVSFEARGGRRVTFHTDAYPSVHANLHAIALGLEALRAVDRYGITETGEQYAGFAMLPAGTRAERGRQLVEAAGGVTEALKKHHPDHGGQRQDFLAVQAYRREAGER